MKSSKQPNSFGKERAEEHSVYRFDYFYFEDVLQYSCNFFVSPFSLVVAKETERRGG